MPARLNRGSLAHSLANKDARTNTQRVVRTLEKYFSVLKKDRDGMNLKRKRELAKLQARQARIQRSPPAYTHAHKTPRHTVTERHRNTDRREVANLQARLWTHAQRGSA